MNYVSVLVDKDDENKFPIENETEKISINDISKPHNGRRINKIEISPNGKYLVTYSKTDNSIVGWNVESVDEEDEGPLEPDNTVQTVTTKEPDETVHQIKQICVSNDKKLAYIYYIYDYKGCKSLNQLSKYQIFDCR